MGQSFSANKELTEPITLPRIYNACQYKSNMPQELQRFTIDLLVDDMNKSGANIRMKDDKGRPYSDKELCRAINSYLPKAEDICMIGSKNSDEAIRKTAQKFQKYYGAIIPIYKNRYDPNSGYRDSEEICDDLYTVQRRVYNSLDKNTTLVKQKLFNTVVQLREQQKALDKEFNQYKSILRKGHNLDSLRSRMKNSMDYQQFVVNEFANQTKGMERFYQGAVQNLGRTIVPFMQNARNSIQTGGNIQVGGANREQALRKKLGGVWKGMMNTAVANSHVKDCFENLGTSIEEYQTKARNHEELKNFLEEKKSSMMMKARADMLDNNNVNPLSESYIDTCARSLLEQSEEFLRSLELNDSLREEVSGHCAIIDSENDINTRQQLCSRSQLCSWINGQCKMASVHTNNDETGLGVDNYRNRTVNFNQYTRMALDHLCRTLHENIGKQAMDDLLPEDEREIINDEDYKFNYPDIMQSVFGVNYDNANVVIRYIDRLVYLLVEELFNKGLIKKIDNNDNYKNIHGLLDTHSSSISGISSTRYLEFIHSDMLHGFAQHIIKRLRLNVYDRKQHTLLGESIDASINNRIIENAGINYDNPYYEEIGHIPTFKIMNKWIYTYLHDLGESNILQKILNYHNNHLRSYVNVEQIDRLEQKYF